MKGILIFCGIFFVVMVLCIANINWAKRTAEIQANNEARQETEIQRSVDNAVKDIKYIKDPRTNLCFAAVSRTGHYYYGIGISQVPCETIPSSLLRVAEVSK